MKTFKGVVLILVGTAWALLWLFIFASIVDHPFYDTIETRIMQAALFFVMLLGMVPVGFGINQFIR
jgi:hypothetical protein